MLVDVKTKAICKIDINSYEAFEILCKTLDMEFVLNDDVYFFVKKDDGENRVYYRKNGHDELYDDRGDLFIALRNVAVNLYPTVCFRSDSYIYNY